MLARLSTQKLVLRGCWATDAHGFWSLSPEMIRKVERRYVPGTLILETTYSESTGAVATVTDFMTIRKKHSCLVRIVRGIKGRQSHDNFIFSALRLRRWRAENRQLK